MSSLDKPIDIILLTCNRIHDTRITIDELYKRIKVPFRLIVVDDSSIDGTIEYLREQKAFGRVNILEETSGHNVSQSYNLGFKYVESEFFFMMQNDITIPDLTPCVTQQLIGLMNKYPENGAIGCRIQRIPNMKWLDGDLSPARKALSAYFRVQRKSDFAGDKTPFGNRIHDDLGFVNIMRKIKGKECSWANNLWADHSRGYGKTRGYTIEPETWGVGRHGSTRQDCVRKPYPKIDPKTNIPLSVITKTTPYMKQPDIDALVKEIDCREHIDVLEWGAGTSTLFFPSLIEEKGKTFSWDSIESSSEWFENIKKLNNKDNVRLYFERRKHGYCNLPLGFNKKYDIVLVDGRHRSRCMINGQNLLKPNGVMLLHDSHRPVFSDGIVAVSEYMNCEKAGKTFLRCVKKDNPISRNKEKLEKFYKNEDPWGYKTNKDDEYRKKKIIDAIGNRKFKKALDIGCGEGWITKDLPAENIYGYELSDFATSRFPENVQRVINPVEKYDLIIATGVMYKQYDYQKFIDIIKKCASGIVILCNIKDWEREDVKELGVPIHIEEFNYRDFKEVLKIYDFTT